MHTASRFRSPHEPNNHQRVLNEYFPRLAYLFGEQPPIDVEVWLEWEHDPPGWVDGQATRWHRHFVFVKVEDDRLRGVGV